MFSKGRLTLALNPDIFLSSLIIIIIIIIEHLDSTLNLILQLHTYGHTETGILVFILIIFLLLVLIK